MIGWGRLKYKNKDEIKSNPRFIAHRRRCEKDGKEQYEEQYLEKHLEEYLF
jgi:hypothetical protein